MIKYTDSRDAIFNELYTIALKDSNVILISCDTGCFMAKDFKKNISKQYYNFGIAEQNAISVSAGLAIEGKKVFVYGITNFVSLRCLEQIRIDVCGMNLPVTIIASGTGYTYSSDGLTHHITEDVSAIRALPNMIILNASSYNSCANFIHQAYNSKSPVYLRFDKGPFKHNSYTDEKCFNEGVQILSEDSAEILLISTGIMSDVAIDVKLESNLKMTILDLYQLKPVNEKFLVDKISKAKYLFTLEEHCIIGGLSSIISEIIARNAINIKLISFGIQDAFLYDVGDREYMRKLNKFDVASIILKIKNVL